MTEDAPAVDVVEEVEVDDARRQAFLRQVYDRYETTRDALVQAKADPEVAGDARQVALAHLADLLGQLRPMLRGTEYWRGVTLGQLDTGDGTVVLEGLQAVFTYRNGYEAEVERETAGRGSNTVTETEVHPLPVSVIEGAVNVVAEFMHEADLLVAHTDEATAKDNTPL